MGSTKEEVGSADGSVGCNCIQHITYRTSCPIGGKEREHEAAAQRLPGDPLFKDQTYYGSRISSIPPHAPDPWTARSRCEQGARVPAGAQSENRGGPLIHGVPHWLPGTSRGGTQS